VLSHGPLLDAIARRDEQILAQQDTIDRQADLIAALQDRLRSVDNRLPAGIPLVDA
jgi:uncharacterized coiled-coil protein SlyX